MFNYKMLLLPFLILLFNMGASGDVTEIDLKAKFNQLYDEWKEWRCQNTVASTSTTSLPFLKIQKLDPRAIPFIMEKLENDKGDYELEIAILLITKKNFEREEWSIGTYGDSFTARKLYIEWWNNGRKQTKSKFTPLYSRWKECKKAEDRTETSRISGKLVRLGIDILPFLVEKIKSGDLEAVILISEITSGEVKNDMTGSQVVDWWKTHRDRWTIPEGY